MPWTSLADWSASDIIVTNRSEIVEETYLSRGMELPGQLPVFLSLIQRQLHPNSKRHVGDARWTDYRLLVIICACFQPP
jgi:hypothetical protein